MPSNSAAWLVAEKKKPFEVGPAPYTPPGENEIVVKNAAVAINPSDWKMQSQVFKYPLNYPIILGEDVAGEVVEVGSSVTRFSVGDRVLGHAAGFVTSRNDNSGFQEYTVISAGLASQIPANISFEAACVLPLALSTAACGMYRKDGLALPYPSLTPSPTGEVLLIWGGSSSVGSNAIQLGVSSGYEVVTTASARNFDYVKKLGASEVFDYHSKTIVEELLAALKGKTIAGVIDAITSDGTTELCAEVLSKSQGRKFICTVLPAAEELPGGVKWKWIYVSDINSDEEGKAVYENFLPKALAEGKFVPAPDPVVVGKGLEAIQDGVDAQQKGVSAKKVVIIL